MKKIIISLLSIVSISCDKESILEMYLRNDCNEDLYVVIYRNYDDEEIHRYSISGNSIMLIAKSDGIHHRRKEEIPFLIKRLDITKDGIPIRINPLDTDFWDFEEVSMYCYKSFLTINPEDFEDE
jgi:hypothetical protein